MKHNRILFLIIEIVFGIVFLVCSVMMVAGERFSSKPRIYALIQDSDGNEQSSFVYGMRSAAADNNVELVVVGTSYMNDAAEQENVIKREVTGNADALIIEPAPGKDTADMISEVMAGIPTVFVKTDVLSDTTNHVIKPDVELMGKKLVEEALSDYRGNRVYTVCKNLDIKNLAELNEYVHNALKSDGIESTCITSASFDSGLAGIQAIDTVIVLDNESLVLVGEYFSDKEEIPSIVGVGHSNEAFYLLEKGIVKSIILPDEYMMGYSGVVYAANSTKRIKSKQNPIEIDCFVLNTENMHKPENEEILYSFGR